MPTREQVQVAIDKVMAEFNFEQAAQIRGRLGFYESAAERRECALEQFHGMLRTWERFRDRGETPGCYWSCSSGGLRVKLSVHASGHYEVMLESVFHDAATAKVGN